MTELETEKSIAKCVEFISKLLNFGEVTFDYEIVNNWEFLFFRTDCYRIDDVILGRIIEVTDMKLIEIIAFDGLTDICFGRPLGETIIVR